MYARKGVVDCGAPAPLLFPKNLLAFLVAFRLALTLRGSYMDARGKGRAMDERLDMLSTARQIGFFSDAYTMEWSYAKAILVRRVLSRVLAGKVMSGQYDRKGALSIARQILFETPRDLLGMEPAVTPVKGAAHAGARGARSGTARRRST